MSIGNDAFRSALERWFQERAEVLALFRYSHAAGSKDFELFLSLQSLSNRLLALPPLTCVTVFRQPQLPLRGLVDEDFVARCLSAIPDGSEYLILESQRRTYGTKAWFHWDAGGSHKELRDELLGLHGVSAAVGLYPPWLADGGDVMSAVVPDAGGGTESGVY